MLLKYFYDGSLAHASYMVGCQRAKVAIVIDPGRDVQQYLDAAADEGLKLVAVAETHIHADYVSGARELADRVGATLYVSDAGPAQWKYEFLEAYSHQLLNDGDDFLIGNIRFDVMHTPGHTPESISLVVTDQGGGADKPMGIFSGDFVFVGAIGRPDLLEEAAGLAGTAESGARDLFRSVARFKQLPDFVQVWPAHGAGSACGKGLGAIPSSTVGYEKRFNPALQFNSEDDFVDYILAEQPEAPTYFAVMKRVNKVGPSILGPSPGVKLLEPTQLGAAIEHGTVIDLATSEDYAAGHVPGTLNIPIGMLAGWAGWLVDYERPVFLLGPPDHFAEALRVLHKMGVEHIAGGFPVDDREHCKLATGTYPNATPEELAKRISNGELVLLDVRSDAEWRAGHVEQARHEFLGRLSSRLDTLPQDKTIVLQCGSGARSAIAVSLLRAAGFKNLINMSGGYAAWIAAGLPTTTLDESHTASV